MFDRFYLCFSILMLLILQSTDMAAAILKGNVSGPDGKPLPFASVYVQGTSIGTTTNFEGNYNIELDKGEYNIVFQYVGFQQQSVKVELKNDITELNVQLKDLEIQTEEVIVKADEDPAYRIIREAIKKRKFYLDQTSSYSCDSYVKGTQKVQNLPDKIMGRSLGKLSEGIDSNGNGIVYLSESVSKLYFDERKYKEIMISSKVSGDDNGFSFNSGVSMKEFNFYENQLTLNDSKLLSPIAQNALISYRYRLDATFIDNGNIVSKIEVIPKNTMGALFHGYIYIINDQWSIHSTELKTSGKAANISLLDTVSFRQVHITLQDSIQKLFSQEIEFNLNVFGIKIAGRFLGVFKNYIINPKLDPKFFNAEVFKVSNDANKKEREYWDSIRPVPLTADEQREYTVKDSLQKIWKSKEYLDSIDRKTNKPGFGMLLTGYTYRNRHKMWSIGFPSPITTVSYNTVQGFYGNLDLEFNKWYHEDRRKWFDIKTQLQYGFSDKKIRGTARFRMKFNDINDAMLEFQIGNKVQQYNSLEPVGTLLNTVYSLFLRKNYTKLYERNFAEIQYTTRFLHNFYFIANFSYQERNALINNSDYSFFYKDRRDFFSNNPLDLGRNIMPDTLFFNNHLHFAADLYLRIRFAQKYVSYPGHRFYAESKYPEIWINYKKAMPLLGGKTNYDYLGITIQKNDLTIGTIGYLTMRGKFGIFLNRRNIEFIDYVHFVGNQTIYAKSDLQWRSYQLLPYYSFSSKNWFAEAHLEHNFRGFLWNKIPVLKKLGFENIAGYHFLYNPDAGEYMEFNFAISRLGWKLFRFGRLDFIGAYKVGEKPKFGMVFSLNFTL